jgi:hypothetical protein
MTGKIKLSVVEFYDVNGDANASYLVPALGVEPERLLNGEQYAKWFKEHEEHVEVSKTILWGVSPKEYLRERVVTVVNVQ